MKKILILIIVILLFYSCFVPNVKKECFGVQSLGGKMTKVIDKGEGKISYTTKGKVNSKIYAYTTVKEYSSYIELGISVYNKDNSPITFNYYTDKFTLIDKKNREYSLTFDIMSYPSKPLNPGSSEYILSQNLSTPLKATDVKAVIIYLGLSKILIHTIPYKTIFKE